jgi:hypothetical protein
LLIFYEGADNTNQMLLASTCIFKSLWSSDTKK